MNCHRGCIGVSLPAAGAFSDMKGEKKERGGFSVNGWAVDKFSNYVCNHVAQQ